VLAKQRVTVDDNRRFSINASAGRMMSATGMLQQLTTDYWDIALKRFAKLNF
jgi:hypothetical protein